MPKTWISSKAMSDLADLTEWAVEARYPGDWPEATKREARAAVRKARLVLDSIRSDLIGAGMDV